jgi:hypothetical protein
MKTLLFASIFIAQVAVANAATTFNCKVSESKVSNLEAGDAFILSLGIDEVFGTPFNTVTAPTLGLNAGEVGAKPEVTAGDDAAYTLTMSDGSQLGFLLRFQSRNQSPAALIFKDKVVAKLLCQILN